MTHFTISKDSEHSSDGKCDNFPITNIKEDRSLQCRKRNHWLMESVRQCMRNLERHRQDGWLPISSRTRIRNCSKWVRPCKDKNNHMTQHQKQVVYAAQYKKTLSNSLQSLLPQNLCDLDHFGFFVFKLLLWYKKK